MATNLLSTTSRVETPFITITVGDTVFGIFSQASEKVIEDNKAFTKVSKIFPNYMKSLQVTKINGQINTYTINMEYTIRAGDDPNLIDKAFSSISSTRKIKVSYGDLSTPSYFFRDESAIVSKITSNVNVSSSTISYAITCTSDALSLNAGTYTFAKKTTKPSDEIKRILYDQTYGLLDIFYGMRDKELVLSKNLIAGDDKKVTIEAQRNVTILDYLNYLVTCMTGTENKSSTSIINKNRYTLNVIDDISGDFGGPYFKVTKVSNNLQSAESLDTFEIDIGYPGSNIVTAFNITDDEMYPILYNYSKSSQQSDYSYRVGDDGEIEYIYSPILSNSYQLMKTTAADKTWWTSVTQYPIKATVTIKGLLRPAVLMSYVKLNVLFFGRKHNSSGYYIITQQQDQVDSNGYKTTLTLLRVKGDSDEFEFYR